MNIKKYIFTFGIVLLALTSCKDDDASSNSMSVNAVFLENASSTVTNHDRQVEFARLGQLIRIQGSGFTGLKRIYINGYETYFNNALVTDNNVWVTVNSKTPVETADPAVRDIIRLYKSDDNYLDYPFVIRAAAPSVSHISLTLPMAGETVIVYGENLQETKKITLPSGTVIESGITCDADGEWYSFVMPDGETAGGSIVSEGANGTAKTPACFNERNGMILDFDGTGTQGDWSAIYGTEDITTDPLNSGRRNVVPLFPESVRAEGGIGAGTNAKGWMTAGIEDSYTDWTRMFDLIPAETPVENVALQFDIYCPEPWTGTGQIEFTLQNNLSTYGYGSTETKNTKNIEFPTAAVWVPWLDTETGEVSTYQTEGWQTITIPLSKFGKYQETGAYTFANVVEDHNSAKYANFGMFFVNTDIELSEDVVFPASRFALPVYVDNWRLVPYEKFTVADFED